MQIRRIRVLFLTPLIALAACGGDDDAPDVANDASDVADEVASDVADEAADDAAEEVADAVGGGGSGTATLTLDNGETFEFSVLCNLEPQTAAGSEILFTAVSYDDISLDITQFGDEGAVTGLATVSVYDASYETLWEASSIYEAMGGTIELSLDGSTIRGAGSFFPAGDIAGTPVTGEVVANC